MHANAGREHAYFVNLYIGEAEWSCGFIISLRQRAQVSCVFAGVWRTRDRSRDALQTPFSFRMYTALAGQGTVLTSYATQTPDRCWCSILWPCDPDVMFVFLTSRPTPVRFADLNYQQTIQSMKSSKKTRWVLICVLSTTLIFNHVVKVTPHGG